MFETMIFGGDHDEYQARAATWDEALEQHERAIAIVKDVAERAHGLGRMLGES